MDYLINGSHYQGRPCPSSCITLHLRSHSSTFQSPESPPAKMRFSLKVFKRDAISNMILKCRQARMGRKTKDLQKKSSEDRAPRPQLEQEGVVPNKPNFDMDSGSIRTEPFPTLSIIEEEYELSIHGQTQTSQKAPVGYTGESFQIQDSGDDSTLHSSVKSNTSRQGLTAHIRRHHKKLRTSLKGHFDTADRLSARSSLSEDTTSDGIKPGSNTPELSEDASSIYSDNEDAEFMAVEMEAILDCTAVNSKLSAAQIDDIHGEIAFLRAGIDSGDIQQRTPSPQPISERNTRSSHPTRRYPTPETDDCNNKRLSQAILSINTRFSTPVNDQIKEDNVPFNRTSASSTNSTEASSITTQSISSYFTARTAASAPFLEENNEEPSNRSSTVSSTASSASNHIESSSTEAVPSPAFLPNGQTTPSLDPSTELVGGKHPFTIEQMIEKDEYCKKREHALEKGSGWLDLLWGFEGLQHQFKRNYRWEPDMERLENFEERRKINANFWILWDFPTKLV
ncbi:hypothetical protein V8E51_005418 [Hyaloscypha variabilis]